MLTGWEKSIAQGEWFEENIAKPWLITNRPDHWITDTRNHKRNGTSGPKIFNGTVNITLPDFRLDDPAGNNNGWIDAKYKKSTFYINRDRQIKYVSLDPKAYYEYSKIVNLFPNMTFDIFYGIGVLQTLYLLDFKNLKPVWHMFDNDHVRYNNGLTPCYPISALINVGIWNPTLMPYY